MRQMHQNNDGLKASFRRYMINGASIFLFLNFSFSISIPFILYFGFRLFFSFFFYLCLFLLVFFLLMLPYLENSCGISLFMLIYFCILPRNLCFLSVYQTHLYCEKASRSFTCIPESLNLLHHTSFLTFRNVSHTG